MSSPNLLYVFADQLHGFGLGCTGHPDARTPHIDALARRGALMGNACSSAPLCTPARITMLTGKYAGSIGGLGNQAGIPEGIPTMAETFRSAGYLTSYVGKWHIGATGNVPVEPRLRAGFEAFTGFQCFNEFQRDVWFFDEAGEKLAFPGRHRTDATFDLAIGKLRAAAADGRPFLLCVSEQAPHYPCQPSPAYLAPYLGRAMTRRQNTRDVDPYTPTQSPPSPPREEDPTWKLYGDDLDAYLRHYHAAMSQLDAGMGRLLAELDALGLTGSTHVIFSSDHGDMQGSHGRNNKDTFYEEAIRIPFIAAGPGIAPGQVRDEWIGTVDFLPTFAELCGIAPPERLHGSSLAGCLRGEAQDSPGEIVVELCYTPWVLVRNSEWKLVATAGDLSPLHLFHLETDPCEMNDRIADPSCADVCQRLVGSLRAWRSRTA